MKKKKNKKKKKKKQKKKTKKKHVALMPDNVTRARKSKSYTAWGKLI